MRITNKMLTNTVLNNINTNYKRLDKYQNQLSSGKLVSRPSDDPVAASRIMTIKSTLQAQTQYDKNMNDALGWLDTTDGALNNANQVLQRVRALAVQGANGTLPDESRKAIAEEIDNLIDEMVQIGNTNYGGRYIFGGDHTTEPPFSVKRDDDGRITEVIFLNGVSDESNIKEIYNLEYEVESGVTMNIAVGQKTFHTNAEGKLKVGSIFEEMINLRNALLGKTEDTDKDAAEIINEAIRTFDKMIDNCLEERSIVGAKSKRMETALSRSFNYQIDMEKLLGRIESVDYAKTTMEAKVQEAVYLAALQVGAKTLQPTLVDFLR